MCEPVVMSCQVTLFLDLKWSFLITQYTKAVVKNLNKPIATTIIDHDLTAVHHVCWWLVPYASFEILAFFISERSFLHFPILTLLNPVVEIGKCHNFFKEIMISRSVFRSFKQPQNLPWNNECTFDKDLKCFNNVRHFPLKIEVSKAPFCNACNGIFHLSGIASVEFDVLKSSSSNCNAALRCSQDVRQSQNWSHWGCWNF